MTRVVIVGGGPAGSSCAIRLAQAGVRATVVECESFPRFHVGESLTGESGLLLRDMGLEDAMAAADYPVKYGVRIYSPSGRDWYWFPTMQRVDGGLEKTFTWQVRRSAFDAMLFDHARALGSDVVHGRATGVQLDDDGRVTGVQVVTDEGERLLACDVLVDASGQGTFLSRAGVTGPKRRGQLDRRIAVFSHFEAMARDEGEGEGNTLLFFKSSTHWGWFIPIDHTVTSVGIVCGVDYFHECGESRDEFLARELREFNPELARRAQGASSVMPAEIVANYSYEVAAFTGPNWLCVGDAHRFVDPLFSFGVNIALAEAKRAVEAVVRWLDGNPAADPTRPFAEFEAWAQRGGDVCETVIQGFSHAVFQFGVLVRTDEDQFIDMLAGRVWDDPDYAALRALEGHLAEQGRLLGGGRPVVARSGE